ncbi:MAG: nucleotidyl transferase AbiEii/AbiGii toxin family protein [Anaerolineales bacterium]
MLDLQQIKKEYSEPLQGYERAIVREYLQYKILQAIFESKQASKLSFLGGTALRIVHGNSRFSEDIDLDNFGLSWQAFGDMIQRVKLFLGQEGFLVEISMVAKEAFHCNLRFPDLLFKQGLSPHQQEKILIQLDTVAQGYDYPPEVKILNKFDVFTEIRVTPLNILLSQKIFTAANRKRPKGRDFYDITFLFSKTKPDFRYINQKMGMSSPERLRAELLQKIEDVNFEALAVDVAPFLTTKEQVNRVVRFREFWKQVEMD